MLTKSATILLVEDEVEQRQLIRSILEQEKFSVVSAANVDEAVQQLERETFDIVVSDWKLPDGSGDDILSTVRECSPSTGFILVTAHADASHAIQLMRAGADDYLPKPFDRGALLFAINKLLYTQQLANENLSLKSISQQRDHLLGMIGQSSAMNKIYQRIDRAAPTEASILINGESGTGKELAASAIHRLSTRSNNVFLPVNCAAIPESLAEAELFGAEKGAYTGATSKRIGKIEAAQGGTLFLDEIGELPLAIQSRLLRFLQEGTIMRVGAHQEIHVDVRIISATNRDLQHEVAEKRFREDLFYRLNVIPVELPPLRERQDDIIPLAQHFLTQFSQKYGLKRKQFDPAAINALLRYSWPGNVRQLRNSMERLTLLSDDCISLADVDEVILQQNEPLNTFVLTEAGLDWEAHEKHCLTQALALCNGNKAQAAKLLNLSYKAFLYRIEKYDISR